MISKPFSRNLTSGLRPVRSYKFLPFFIVAVFVFGGCSHKTEVPLSVSEAQKKFEAKCLKDFNLHVRTREVGRTFWVYLPTKDPIFDYEVQTKNTAGAEPKNASPLALNYSDGKFANGVFSFEYDVIKNLKTKPGEDYGFNSSYTDSYIKNQNNIYTAISDVFFNSKPKAGEKQPQFFSIIITDIKKGIETRSIFYLQDFMRYWAQDIPYEELMKRFLADQKGSAAMIGDETGTHVQYRDIPMSEFLTKQILNRIRFKFQRSDFPPSPDYDKTIMGIVADTLRYYNFEDFTNVRLNNMRTGKKYIFDKQQLSDFGEDKPPEPKSRLIHIRFKDGQVQFNDEKETSQTNQSL